MPDASTALPTTDRPPTPGGPALRRARAAVTATFVAHGTLIGAWAPRIPEIKSHLGLSAGALGVALLAPALGTVLAARTVGTRCAQHGSAAVTRVTAVVYCLLAAVPALAPNLAVLWLALLVWGAAMGAFDVAMNSQGVTVETAYRRPVLSGFHAAWSIGTFVGAVLGGVGAARGIPIARQQVVLGVVLAVAVVSVAGKAYLADPPHDAGPRRRRRTGLPHLPERRLLLLGAAAIFALMAEGAAVDWSGVLLRDHLHVTGGRVSLAYAAFNLTMTTGRLLGDRVVHAVGRARCFAGCAVLGAGGLAAGLAVDSLGGAVGGFATLGLGLSIMVPVLFSAAADTDGPSGPAIATVSALGCVGLLVGPSLIGFVAQVADVSTALFMLPPFTLAAAALGIAGIRRSRTVRSETAPIGPAGR